MRLFFIFLTLFMSIYFSAFGQTNISEKDIQEVILNVDALNRTSLSDRDRAWFRDARYEKEELEFFISKVLRKCEMSNSSNRQNDRNSRYSNRRGSNDDSSC